MYFEHETKIPTKNIFNNLTGTLASFLKHGGWRGGGVGAHLENLVASQKKIPIRRGGGREVRL